MQLHELNRKTAAQTVTADAQQDTQQAEHLTYVLLALFSGWGSAILTFGLPGLIFPALLLVPICFVALVLITVGR